MTTRSALMLALAGLALSPAMAAAQTVVWSNIQEYPADLLDISSGWSAVRSEPPHFVSYRCAADDFVLTGDTQIRSITFYSFHADNPIVIGGDWYIYTDEGTGLPGTLLESAHSQPIRHDPTGIVHPRYGMIYENELETPGLFLPAGRYFLGVRTYQTILLGVPGKNTNAMLTTLREFGDSRGSWTFDLFADGTLAGPWVPMTTFAPGQSHEWAFVIEGETECYADCDSSTGPGVLDIFDFLCFGNRFSAGDPYACDCDTSTGMGVCDIFDFLCFGNAFGAGCP